MATSTDIRPEQIQDLPLFTNDGDELGKIEAIYINDDTGAARWAALETGRFGKHETLVPMVDAVINLDAKTVTVPYDSKTIKSAPHRDPAEELDAAYEEDLCQHYKIDAPDLETETGTEPVAATATADTGDTEAAAPTEGDSLTLSEERLRVGKRTAETGRVRLRKYVVTEQVTQTIPVTREEVRVIREPLEPGDTGEDIDDGAVEVVLHEERPVVAKETVATERVRLATEVVTDEATVTETVRKEQLDSPE